jgi:prepilin-type N-terminal cleavage/methylation domain-containing protein
MKNARYGRESMNLFHKKTFGKKGFTLIEVIALLIILGIVAAVAASRGMSNESGLIAQADIVKSHLRFAQLKALSDDIDTWSIVFTSSSYSLSCSGTILGNNCPATINLPSENSGTHTFPTGVAASPVTVTFDSWGSPGTANVTVTLTQDSISKPITITNNTGYILP